MIYTGNTADLPALFGLKIITRPIPHRLVQAKTHRRKRLNKKWLKRYGYKSIVAPYDRFEVLTLGPNVYAFPEGIEAIKKALDKANQEALQRDEKTMLTGSPRPLPQSRHQSLGCLSPLRISLAR